MSNDPLLNSPPAGMALLHRFTEAANGFPVDAAIDAACNILINALRQTYPTRDKAAERFDEIAAKAKGLLIDQHYDAFGRKRGVFPYPQHIHVPLVRDRDRAN